MPQEDGPYSAAWRRCRLWSWAFWIVFVGYLPALAVVARVLGWAGEGNAIFLTAFVWMIGFALVGYQKGNMAAQSVRSPVHALRLAQVGRRGSRPATAG